MRKLSTIPLLLLLLVFTGCTVVAPASVPAPAATDASVAPATAEPSLVGPWQWVAFNGPTEQFDVATPLSYVLAFHADGTLNIVADCNHVGGSYTADAGSLTITVGSMTMAACLPDSRSDQFVKLVGNAAIYFFQDGELYIDLKADGGTLHFAPAPADILADDGEGALDGAQEKLVATLGNLSYPGSITDEPIMLTAGRYEYSEAGSAGTPFVRLLDGVIAHGDLDGDATEDAVALLEHESSGTGRFTYLVPVLDVWNAPTAAAPFMLGDRIQVKALTLTAGEVVADYIAQGPGDGQCCPTWNVHNVFAWQDGALVERSREEVSQVTLADLNGTGWRLVDLNNGTEPVLPAAEVTLQFGVGTLSGLAGCNTYNGTVTSPEATGQTLTIGPLATTRNACEEPIATQETNYLARLGSAVGWGYDGGYLSITYVTSDNVYTHLLFAAAVAAEPAVAVAPERPAGFSAAWETVACEEFALPKDVVESSDCGYVTVPEHRAAGTDKTIQLAVVRIRSTAETPGAPVILGTGGPGDDGLGRLKFDPSYLAAHANILAARDWIAFTQRGTAGAQPELGCPELDRVPLNAAMQGLSLEANLELRKTALQACIDRFVAEGVDLTAYNSVENAADVVDILDTLGYDKFYYYGQSYGTMLGQYLLKDHGDRLLGIILDGIAPLTHKTWPSITDFPAAYQRVFAACAADAACAAAYPEPEAALAAGLQALDANPPSLTVKTAKGELTVSVDSTLAMRALFLTLYTSGGYAAVPWLAYELSNGNSAPLASNIGLLFGNSGDTLRVMHFAVVCSDDPIFSLDELVTDGVPPMYRGAQADDALDYVTACPLLALPQLPDRYDELAESEIPALLLQGGLDPATGVPVGSTVQEGLPNSTNVIFPASGHIVGNSPCGIALMDAFMRDPTARPDTSCVDPAIPFYLAGPQVVSSPDGSVTLGITLPDDFGPMGPGGWQSADAIVALNFEEKVTTAEEAAALRLALLSAPAETELGDGLALAGLPSRVGHFLHPQYGDAEVYGFADAKRAYTVVIIVRDPSKAEAFRTETQPALLESVTLDGE